MRILFLSYEWPPIGGGGGRAANRIASLLAGRGHETSAMTSLYGDLPQTEIVDGVSVYRIRVRRSNPDECSPSELLSFMFHSMAHVTGLVRKKKPEVICAFFAIPGGPAAWWAKRRTGIPYLLALRGSDIPRPELQKKQRLHMFTGPVIRQVLGGAGAVTAVSEALRDAALKVAPSTQIEVVPNGVDTSWFQPKRVQGPGADKINLLYVGRLRDFKRVQDIIEGLREIEIATGRKARLVVAGSGPYHKELDALAKARSASVEFRGWMDREALRDAYEEADVVLLPSLVEGHPNVLLEAMAMGKPVIGADVPGTREAFRDGIEGLLVPPRMPGRIAEAVVRIVSQPETWQAFSQNARKRAEESSWEHVADRYEEVLGRLAKGGAH